MEDRVEGRKASPGIDLLGGVEDSTEIHRERLQRTAGRRLRPIILGLAVFVLPAIIIAAVVTDRGPDSAGIEQGDPNEFAEAAEAAEPDPGGSVIDGLDAAPGGLPDYAANGDDILRDSRYSPVAAALDDVVVTASIGTGSRADVLGGPIGRMGGKLTNPLAVTSIELDASGHWAAGSYANSFGLEVLVVGPTGDGLGTDRPLAQWALTPLAVGINGFAWHPSAPGTLAYAENNLTQSTTVTVRDFTTERPSTRRFSAEFPGQLSVWGDWGFAFRQPGPLPFTSVGAVPEEQVPTGINPLVVIAEGIPGAAMGIIAPGRLLIDGGETATILNTRNAVFEENVWFEPTEQVVSFRESPDERFSVGQLIDRGDSVDGGGWAVLFAADPDSSISPADRLFFAAGPTVFDWTASGRFVAGYQPAKIGPEGNKSSASSVVVYDLERALSVAREIRIDRGQENSSEPDLGLTLHSLAFSEPFSD